MGTAREHAANAVAALCGLPKLPAAGDDAARLTGIVEAAVKSAVRDGETKHEKRAARLQAAAQHRLMRLVNSAPAVIYSPGATGGFAPTFVNDNIRRVLGYPPSEHMQDPGFWR